jgi:TolB-like protein
MSSILYPFFWGATKDINRRQGRLFACYVSHWHRVRYQQPKIGKISLRWHIDSVLEGCVVRDDNRVQVDVRLRDGDSPSWRASERWG